jgi:hypothetical protein
MRRHVRYSLVALSLSLVALVAVGFTGVAWNHRADDICREKAPRTASGYTVRWEWGELAYVCDYAAAGEDTRRVGITEVFRHPGPRPQH